jgi:hypothetical protein
MSNLTATAQFGFSADFTTMQFMENYQKYLFGTKEHRKSGGNDPI